ncbi:MAG: hypothetical protein FWC16_04930 [Defluviitaleaceae bacterium]|nr:hypothetical protein [Defluviitaleaceae bacterium]MCL2274251.1 hypothetical protein [Defluviitaleaceae bacterium]
MEDNGAGMSTGKSIALFLFVLVGGAVLVSVALYFVLSNFRPTDDYGPLVGRWEAAPIYEDDDSFLVFEFSGDGLWSLSFNNENGGDVAAYGRYVFSHDTVVLRYNNGRIEIFDNVRFREDYMYIWGDERPPFRRVSNNTYISVAALLHDPDYDPFAIDDDEPAPEITEPADYLFFTVYDMNIRFREVNDLWNELHYSLTLHASLDVPNRVDIDINLYDETGRFLYTLPLENSIHRGSRAAANTGNRLFEAEMGVPAYGTIIIRGRDVDEAVIPFTFYEGRAVLNEQE